jgi:hypothetical protein
MPAARPPASIRFVSMLCAVLVAAVLLPTDGTAQDDAVAPEAPLRSLRQASPSSDADLVALATDLLRARAQFEIGFYEYKKGVRFFRTHHPAFYGPFFGDPNYAPSGARYARLARARQFARPAISALNSIWDDTWFFCSPLAYDPALGGSCEGLRFAAADFFFLPGGPAFTGGRTSYPDAQAFAFTYHDAPDASRFALHGHAGADRWRTRTADRRTAAAVDRPEPGDLQPVAGTIPTTPDEIAVPSRPVDVGADRPDPATRLRALMRVAERQGGRLSMETREEGTSRLHRVRSSRDIRAERRARRERRQAIDSHRLGPDERRLGQNARTHQVDRYRPDRHEGGNDASSSRRSPGSSDSNRR